MLKIYWPYKITNSALYERCNEKELSNTIRKRRLRWTGHLLRLDENTTARKALRNITHLGKGKQVKKRG